MATMAAAMNLTSVVATTTVVTTATATATATAVMTTMLKVSCSQWAALKYHTLSAIFETIHDPLQ